MMELLNKVFYSFLISFCIFGSFSSVISYSDVKDESIPDQKLEYRAQSLFSKVRCMVCNGETIRDSDAYISYVMRRLIRQKILNNQTDEEILLFIRAKYGDHAILEPPTILDALLLKFFPILIILVTILFRMKKQN